MSRISDIEQAKHFIVTDEEVRKRFHSLITDFGLPVHHDLELKNLSKHRFPPEVFINCNFHGNVNNNNFDTSVFFESQLKGNYINNSFRESDFIGGSLSGRFLDNKFQGAYLRYVDISSAIFRDLPPQEVIQVENKTIFHKSTGRIIFCSGVENSLIDPEPVATFRPIVLDLGNGHYIKFLARFYFDGEHRKLGLISSSDIAFTFQEEQTRMWPNFIYTLTNESKDLREHIEKNFIRDFENLKDEEQRFLDEVEYSGYDTFCFRPARPLDTSFLVENSTKIDPRIKEILHLEN